jgi:thiol:disulfide interchange protein
MNDLRRIAGFVALLAFVWLLVLFGPLLVALAIAWPKREGQHPLLVLFGLIALLFYTLKRLSTSRTSPPLPLTR